MENIREPQNFSQRASKNFLVDEGCSLSIAVSPSDDIFCTAVRGCGLGLECVVGSCESEEEEVGGAGGCVWWVWLGVGGAVG